MSLNLFVQHSLTKYEGGFKMGAAVPVVGAVMGVASAVQQVNAAQQQANAQRNALDLQAQIEDTNTKLRLIELQRQKLYSDFNFQIQTASREIQKFSDAQQLAAAKQQDLLLQQQKEYEARASAIQQMQQTLGLDQQAMQSLYGSQQQAAQIIAAESEQGRQALLDQANALAAINAQQSDVKTQYAKALAQLSGGATAGWSLSDIANAENIRNVNIDNLAASIQKYYDIADQVSQGRLNAQQVAELIKQYGQNEANFLAQSANASRQFIETSKASQLADIASNRQQNLLGFEAARAALESQYAIEEANQRLNQAYYDIQNKSDIATIRNAGAQAQAALAVQRSAIQSPSSFGILSALAQGGMSIANVFANRSVTPSSASTYNYSSQPIPGSGQFPGYGTTGGTISFYRK